MRIWPLIACVLVCLHCVVVSDADEVPGDSQKIYFIDFGTDKVQRSDLDGTNVQDLFTFPRSSFCLLYTSDAADE